MDSYREYKHEYLRTTHRQAFLAWTGGVLLTLPFEVLVDLLYRPLPLVRLAWLRVLIVLLLYWSYRMRVRAEGEAQLTWIYVNFHVFSVFMAYIGSIVDPILQFPVYVSAGFVIAGACAHYPSRPPTAFLFPISVGASFGLSYLFFCGGTNTPGVLVLGILMATCPFLSSFGSIRLENSLRGAWDLNVRLKEEIEYTRQAKARLATTFGCISDAVVALNSEGRVELVNQEAQILLGRRSEEILGRHIRDLLILEGESGNAVSLSLAHEWNSPADTYLKFSHKSLPVRLACSPIVTEVGERSGSVIVIQDLSEIRKQEEKRLNQVRLESLGVLAGGIAHDFNNVLTMIQGNLSLMELEVDQGHPTREPLLEADIALQRARELSNQLLTFSKGGEPRQEVVALAPLVADTVEMYLKGSRVKARLALDSSLMANVDSTQMGQVFQNLVINAAQAMPEGGILEVSLRRRGEELELTFGDNGPGIPDAIMDQIFDPYFSTKKTGSGLGLATSYSVISRHGGTLSAGHSKLGGAEFVVTLPIAELPPEQESAQPRKVLSHRALVMDDEAQVAKVTCRMLTRLGLEAVSAQDGEAALRLYKEAMEEGKPFSVVLIDLTVPQGMGGREMIERLLEYDPEAKGVVASGYSADPVMGKWASYGFVGSLSKPYGIQQLKEVLKELNLLAQGT